MLCARHCIVKCMRTYWCLLITNSANVSVTSELLHHNCRVVGNSWISIADSEWNFRGHWYAKMAYCRFVRMAFVWHSFNLLRYSWKMKPEFIKWLTFFYCHKYVRLKLIAHSRFQIVVLFDNMCQHRKCHNKFTFLWYMGWYNRILIILRCDIQNSAKSFELNPHHSSETDRTFHNMQYTLLSNLIDPMCV